MLAKKISRNTALYRLLVRIFWLGFGLLVLAVGLFLVPDRARLPFLIGPVIVWLLGSVLLRRVVGGVVDEVWDCGDHLLVRSGDQQESVPFSNIMNVNATVLVNPPRITLRLIKAGRFGQEIAFLPPRPPTMNPFARNALADELIERAHAARVHT